MSTIQWRPEVNALTTPQSYKILHVPHGSVGYDDMAADISLAQPVYSPETVRNLAPLIMEWIQTQLINGRQVTFPDAFSFIVSFIGRLDSPDDPLPASDDLLRVNVRVSPPFIKEIRHQAKLERLPMTEKLPLITSAEDTKLMLDDVLNPDGVLHLTGSNLAFDKEDPECSCVIAGTQSGESKQDTFALISNSEILLVPSIPAQANPWNNEYLVKITTQYTEHGTPRTGIYRHRLRTPLTVPGLGLPSPPETGILTDNSATVYVGVNAGTLTADERLRIQVLLDQGEDRLLFNLIDMKENGSAGATVPVTEAGEYILPGFSGSAVSALELTVNDYAALKTMVRNHYSGRLVDILDVKLA